MAVAACQRGWTCRGFQPHLIRLSNVRIMADQSGPRARDGARDESLKDLFRQLAEDASRLLRQELALAKLEMRETAEVMAMDGARIAAGAALALLGGFCLLAFVIIFVGDVLLGDNYWLSALIVGLILVVGGALLARAAIDRMQSRKLKPVAAVEALRDHGRWAGQEVRDLASGIRS
jgi:hypothetical protein